MDTVQCDVCEEYVAMGKMGVVWHQPWHKQYWGQIMWTCDNGECMMAVGAVPAKAGDPNYEIVKGVNDYE